MANKIIKTEIVKKNLKTFNKEITSFNKRLKRAEKKGAINKSTYKMLMLDKEKKDFYRANIYTKRQFNNFINTLKKANKETLKKGRDVKKLGSIVNELAPTRYEKYIIKRQLKKVNLLKKTFGQSYNQVLFDVAEMDNKKNRMLAYEKLFNRYLKLDYDTPNKTARFKDNFEKVYKDKFGVKPNLKGMNLQAIHNIAKMKRFDFRNFYDVFINPVDLKEEIDELIEMAKKKKIKDIDEEWELYE